MKKIKHPKDLPTWFDLEKYKFAEDLDASDWFIQLSRRKEIYNTYELIINDKKTVGAFFSTPGNIGVGLIIQKNLQRMRDKPIHTELPTIETAEDFHASLMEENYKKDLIEQPVRDLSFYDLACQRQYDEWETTKNLGAIEQPSRWHSLDTTVSDDLILDLSSLGSLGHKGYAAYIDLNASDTALKSAFNIWLTNIRKITPPQEKRPTLYKNWARFGLLPYLDLKIWEMECGVSITGNLMSASISSGIDRGVARFRKNFPYLATSLMNDLSMIRIEAANGLATGSSSEQKSKT